MKKTVFISILLSMFLLGACTSQKNGSNQNYGDDPSSNPGGNTNGDPEGDPNGDPNAQQGDNWSEEIQQEMLSYFGEVLPYVSLKEETLYHEYSNEYEAEGFGAYYVGDDSEVNVLDGYADLLLADGFESFDGDEGEVIYSKTNEKTYFFVQFDYYEKTEEYEAGNEIAVYFQLSEGGNGNNASIETLLDMGYVEYQEWPKTEVDEITTNNGVNLVVEGIDGPFYVYVGEEEELSGDIFPVVYVAIEGDFASQLDEALVAAGTTPFDFEDYLAYYSDDYGVVISLYVQNGLTFIEINGQYPLTLEDLIAEGYEEVEGWPNEMVLETVMDEKYLFEGVNLEGKWYVNFSTVESDDDLYNDLILVSEGSFLDELDTNLLAANYYYDEEYVGYFSSDDAVDVYCSLNNGLTVVEICGPYYQEEFDLGEATDNVFVKVTSADQLVDGLYLIVNEANGVILDSSLDNLDTAQNNISVNISNNTIQSTTGLEAIAITYDSSTNTLKTSDGLYIGHSGSKNTLDTSSSEAFANEITFDDNGNASIKCGDYYLRFNGANDQMRFRYYKQGQQDVQLYLLSVSN